MVTEETVMNSPGSRVRIAWAVVFAAGGVAYALIRPTPANFLIMASMLLLGWNMVFTPRPASRSSLQSVYEQARAGTYRTSMTAKLVALASLVLFAAGICMNVLE